MFDDMRSIFSVTNDILDLFIKCCLMCFKVMKLLRNSTVSFQVPFISPGGKLAK